MIKVQIGRRLFTTPPQISKKLYLPRDAAICISWHASVSSHMDREHYFCSGFRFPPGPELTLPPYVAFYNFVYTQWLLSVFSTASTLSFPYSFPTYHLHFICLMPSQNYSFSYSQVYIWNLLPESKYIFASNSVSVPSQWMGKVTGRVWAPSMCLPQCWLWAVLYNAKYKYYDLDL